MDMSNKSDIISLGITIEKGKANFVVIQGQNKEYCDIKAAYTLNFNPTDDHLMEQFRDFFNEAITQYKPNIVGYKIASQMNLKNSQIDYLYEPIGVLKLLCNMNGIEYHSLSAAAIQNKKSKRLSKFEENFTKGKSESTLSKGKEEAGVIAWEVFQ